MFTASVWDTKEDHQNYGKWRRDRGDMEPLISLTAEPLTVTYFDVVDPN